jgi:two-component system CheB/CheR fusion protein
LERLRRGEGIDHYETVRQRKDGSLIDISLSISPVKDAAGKVVGASKVARDISEKKQAETRQELLTREIQHRTKNLFAVVLAVVSRSFAGKYTVKDAEAAVVSRLRSLGQTHVMLIDKEWQGADLAEIVRSEMSPYAGRVKVEGPNLMMTAKAAQNFALALHELATTQKGFGSTVLEQIMAEHFGLTPQIQFPMAGIVYELNGSLDTLVTNERISVPSSEAHEPA